MASPSELLQTVAVRLVVRFPFWTEVFYSMQVHELNTGNDRGVETLATDGRNLYVCKDFFERLTLDEKVGVVVHELCHKIFLHTTRRGHRDPKLWNSAADYAINNLLVANGITLPKGGLVDPKYNDWSAERIYDDLKQQIKDGAMPNPDGVPGPKMPGGGFDLLEPEFDSVEEAERYDESVKQLVERATAMAKAMGQLPAGIEAGIATAYAATKEPWYNHLHRFMQALSMGEYNWARQNRRALHTHGVFAPMHYSEALDTVMLYVDSSGSCFAAAEQAHFATHINAILAEAKPRRVLLSYFDSRVYDGESVEPGCMEIELKPKGGGGTSFIPIFQHVEESGERPDVVIILTDMMGSFPEDEPDYPVIWADTYGKYTAPFGETLHVE